MLNLRFVSRLGSAIALLLLVACGDSQGLLRPESVSVDAVIQGAYDDVFLTDNGDFWYGETTPGGLATATVYAGYEEDGVVRNILLRRYGHHRFPTGSYQFELIDPSSVHPGIRFEFWRKSDGLFDRFAADQGTLEVTESTRERLEGTFVVQAFRYCREELGQYGYTPVDGPCQIPDTTIDGAPRITVTGAFVVVGR